MYVRWIVTAVGDYILAFLAWTNHVEAIYGGELKCGQNEKCNI